MGYLAAATVTLIWATWLVVSRFAAQSTLTVYDLAALRYGVSAIVALPFVWYYKPWRHMSIARIATVSFLLSPLYILSVFLAFRYAPAAHGGIFMNGAMPAITLLIVWIGFGQRAHRVQWAGVSFIVIGTCMAAADVSTLSLAGAWIGDGLFLIGAIFFSIYLVLGRRWRISTTQVLLCSSMVNGLLYLPVWYWILPSGFADVSRHQFLLQAFYQGLIPGLFGLVLVAYASRNIGPAATSAFMAAVPALGTVLGAVFLREIPGMLGWLSLVVLTPGILMVAIFSR